MKEFELQKKFNWELASKLISTPTATEFSGNLDFKIGSVGSKVSFAKKDYANAYASRDVIIPGVLELARANQGGLYNAALEEEYDSPGPTNTEWSSPFVNATYTSWAPLWDLSNRTFDSWRESTRTPEGQASPPLQVGMHMVLRETTTSRTWLIIFTQWTYGGNGGGFAYDRIEILPSVYFEKPSGQTSTVDKISAGVWLARNNNGALYNAISETDSEEGLSPVNTRWNSTFTDSRDGYSGFADLSNLESRVYTDFISALDGAVGNNLPGTDLVMHDLSTDLYYKIVFDSWQQGGGSSAGAFAYTRTVIPQSAAIKFADGTVLNTVVESTASGSVIDAQGNTIISDSSNNLVSVGNGAAQLINNFSGMLIVNDHFDGRVETWIAGGGTTVLLGATNLGGGTCNSTLTMASGGYEWTNVDNLSGPFTFTVIKTRQGS